MAAERSDNILTLIFNRVFHNFGHTSEKCRTWDEKEKWSFFTLIHLGEV